MLACLQSGNNTISRNLINRGPRNSVGLFGPHYVAMSTVNYSQFRTAAATAANKALGGNDYGLYDVARWGFDTMFPTMHTRNNTIMHNEFSNLVRDRCGPRLQSQGTSTHLTGSPVCGLDHNSCDPGLVESYGVGKGQRVIANAIHDVTIPPKRWGSPNEALSSEVQVREKSIVAHTQLPPAQLWASSDTK